MSWPSFSSCLRPVLSVMRVHFLDAFSRWAWTSLWKALSVGALQILVYSLFLLVRSARLSSALTSFLFCSTSEGVSILSATRAFSATKDRVAYRLYLERCV